MTDRVFPIEDILSLTTGRVLSSFSSMHECAEFVAGHPIWTHEFASGALWLTLREAVFAQHPQLQAASVDGITRDNWQAYVARFREEYGPTLSIKRGTAERAAGPAETLVQVMAEIAQVSE